MYSTILLAISFLCLAYLLPWVVSYLFLFFFGTSEHESRLDGVSENKESVAVLVPCHHEGVSIVRTVETLLGQNYEGVLTVVVLLDDSTDSSCGALLDAFFDGAELQGSRVATNVSSNRILEIHCTGKQQKKDKLNAVLSSVAQTYVAFLDADHRAKPNWIATSVSMLESSDACGVQSCRGPLSLRHLAQLWDSAENHIGNELVNRTLDRCGSSVFFTGTTCVFRNADITSKRFSDCITEDTYLSYQLISEGKRLVYNPHSGSNEEVAPDIGSYLARRRRWSCGHNQAFFSFLRELVFGANRFF